MEKRLNKVLSEAGVCSRREADRLIEAGQVKVDGIIAQMGMKVTEVQHIEVRGKEIGQEAKEEVVLAFYKPQGVVCTTSRKEPDNIIDYIKYPKRIYPVGRLDKDSEGLILLTNNGELMDHILRSRYGHEKEYIVKVNKRVRPEIVAAMEQGVPILDTMTKPCKVKLLGEREFSITLTQGLNRQIRRMCEYFGYRVVTLKRIRVMNIRLDGMKCGSYRKLTAAELKRLKTDAMNV